MQFEFANYEGKLQAEDLLTPQDNVQTLSRASAQKVKTIFEHDFVKKKNPTQKSSALWRLTVNFDGKKFKYCLTNKWLFSQTLNKTHQFLPLEVFRGTRVVVPLIVSSPFPTEAPQLKCSGCEK